MTYMSISVAVATTTIYEKNQGRRGSRNLAGTFFAKKIGKLFRATILVQMPSYVDLNLCGTEH